MQTFLTDLDDYFCKKFANYTQICAIPNYRIPDLYRVGSTEYHINDERYKLCYQADKESVLQTFKDSRVDKGFSFFFAPVPPLERLKDVFRKHTFSKLLPAVFKKYSLDLDTFYTRLNVSEDIWKKIVKGSYYPEKNSIFAIVLAGAIGRKDAADLLAVCGYAFSDDDAEDVVISYLVEYQIFSPPLIGEALEAYHISNIPIRL